MNELTMTKMIVCGTILLAFMLSFSIRLMYVLHSQKKLAKFYLEQWSKFESAYFKLYSQYLSEMTPEKRQAIDDACKLVQEQDFLKLKKC